MNLINHKLRCIVVEDEDSIRQWLCDRLNEFEEVEVIGHAASVNNAYRLIAQTKPNALFLDIKIIGGDAFQLLQRLKDNGVSIPPIVMTTGFDEYAISTINDWGDYVKKYLMKPFVEDWELKLQESIDALFAAVEKKKSSPPPQKDQGANHFFVKNGSQLTRINFEELLWIEVAGGGAVYLVTSKKEIKFDKTLTKTLSMLPAHFLQISREFAVNARKINRVDKEDRGVLLNYNGKEKFLGIGDAYYGNLLKSLKVAK